MAALLSSNHWVIEQFKERMPTKTWRAILLAGEDTIIVRGRLRQLVGKNLGAGVYEVSKEPLEED